MAQDADVIGSKNVHYIVEEDNDDLNDCTGIESTLWYPSVDPAWPWLSGC